MDNHYEDDQLPTVDDTRLVTLRDAVPLIYEQTGVFIPRSRLHKDSASGVLPPPDAIYGKTYLYRPRKLLDYARSLIRPFPPEAA